VHTFDPTVSRSARAILDYAFQQISTDDWPLDGPRTFEELEAAVGPTITAQGIGADAALAAFVDVLAPACISTDSTRFLSFIPAAPTKMSLLFDLVVGASSLCGTSWLEAAGAIYAENQALRWLSDLAGLPEGAGGCFVSGGSAANLSALVTARASAARGRERPARWRVAVGEHAHSSIISTLKIMDVDAVVIPSDDQERLAGAGVRAALAADADHSIFAVAATAGTTNAGIVDDLASIAAVTSEFGTWLHVDAAYGGAALAAPSQRELFDGIEFVDSLTIDPHKWLFSPFDCAALIYREPALAAETHAQHASYLDAIHLNDGWNPSDYAYHLTRRVRGLPFWFSVAAHGTDAYRDAIETTLATARRAAAMIEAAPHVELVRDVGLSVVLFRRIGWHDADYLAWANRLLVDRIALSLPTRWNGEMVARWVFINPLVADEDIAQLLETMV
jgi:glutamate/tyrosine decarboxylase-like PLP-dependent enzyme